MSSNQLLQNQPLNHMQSSPNPFEAVLHLPPLLTGHDYIIDQDWLAQFRQSANIPADSSYQGNPRLGFYYQWLWQQLILEHPHYDLVAEELQLHDNKQTLGAIDFLVRNLMTGELEHWEVAIKFYLAWEQSWPGPNAKDNLDKKAKRMLEHQLALSDHMAYQQQLSPIFGQVAVRRLIMQGRLFYPEDQTSQGSGISLNPGASIGRWCYSHQLQDKILRPLTKREWIAPPPFSTLATPPLTGVISHPAMAVDAQENLWFVMPDHWPAQQPEHRLGHQMVK